MVEVKADALEQSFEAFEQEDDGVAALRAELDLLKAKIASGAIAAQRPALDGVKSAEAAGFVDPSVIDTASSVDVQLIDGDQWLISADDTALAAGANLALIGGELVQFGDVTPLGSGRFRLTRILRGRVGTELAVSGHAIDDVFCLIETGSLQSIALPISSIGSVVTAAVPGAETISIIVRPRANAIPAPSGGTTIDAEARTSIDQILATLRQHGLIDA